MAIRPVDEFRGQGVPSQAALRAEALAQPFGATTIVKEADETRNNDGTVTADPELAIEAEANATYVVDAWLRYTSAATADITLAVLAPSADITMFGVAGLNPGAGGVSSNTVRSTDSVSLNAGGADADELYVNVRGVVTVGSTPTTISLGWAQQTAEASDTTVYSGSWFRSMHVA